jgi:hypothetical protein
MRRISPVLVSISTLAVLFTAFPASAAPSSVSGLTATASGTVVTVTGTAAFGAQDPLLVGDDATNDNVGGATTAPLGIDLDGMLISQPDPNAQSLVFTIDLNGMTGDGIPEHLAYNWDIRVDGGSSANGAEYSIKTWRTRVAQTTNTNPYAAVFTCVPSSTGGSSCTPGPLVAAVYDASNSQIRMTIPFDAIGAKPGSTIDAWNRISAPVWVGGTAATQTAAGLYDTGTHSQYVVPTKTVRLGVAPTGSPISYTASAALSGSGFSGSLAVPGPGTYDVGAQACFGDNCGTSKVTVTVG